MGFSTLSNVRFAGMATCLPRRIVHNINDAPESIRSDRERLVRNIGIETRRVCAEGQTFSDLAFLAAEKLLTDLQWQRSDIDAVIVVTQSPDYITPATAVIMQDRLGLPNTTLAFDVTLGCSGYPFGLHILGSMISAGSVKKGLVLVGDRPSTYTASRSPLKDPLFSDAGTVTALEYQDGAPPMYFGLHSDGSGHKAIMLPVGGHRDPFKPEHAQASQGEDGFWNSPLDLILDGPAVLSFSTQRIPAAVESLLDYAGISKESVDHFVFHQANKMINETIRKKLRLPEEKVPSTLREFGNTSGASLPVTVTARLKDDLDQGKRRLLLCGFGIGLSWGSVIVDIQDAQFPAMLES